MDGHVIHALFALLDYGVAEEFPAELGRIILDFFQRLVHRHRANRDGGVTQNPLARGVNIVAGGQVHHGIRAPLRGPRELVDLLINGRRHRGIAHIRVEFGEELRPDDHRLGFRMVDIARHDRATGGEFGTDQLGVAMLSGCDEPHFRRDDVVSRIPHLRNRMP